MEESKFVIWERVKWHEHYDNHEKMPSYSNKKKVWVSSSSIVQVLKELDQNTADRNFSIRKIYEDSDGKAVIIC